ncbi:acetyltransferase [Lederbergia galactosidilytica]|uniref:Acetyltransferase n=2 Tax=Lederbergia galactosidilytica TaxID=217031 RepID=A0A0Q9YAI4_9BACI|nr:acetyltransferase [Lederbergia galactosidilytica]
MLIQWAIQRAKERGCHMVQLTTDKNRPEALHFYEKLGFNASHQGLKMHL